MCCKWRRERKTTEGLARGVANSEAALGLFGTWLNLFFQLKKTSIEEKRIYGEFYTLQEIEYRFFEKPL